MYLAIRVFKMPSIERYLLLDSSLASMDWPYPSTAKNVLSDGGRSKLIRWLAEVSETLDLELTVYTTAVKIMDVFCAHRGAISCGEAQGFGCAALDVAFKVCPDQIEDFCIFSTIVEYTDGAATKDSVEILEGAIVTTLRDGCILPSIVQFIMLIVSDTPGVYYRTHIHAAIFLGVRIMMLGVGHTTFTDLTLAVNCLRQTGDVANLPHWIPENLPDPKIFVGPAKMSLDDSPNVESRVESWIGKAIDRQLAAFMCTDSRKRAREETALADEEDL